MQKVNVNVSWTQKVWFVKKLNSKNWFSFVFLCFFFFKFQNDNATAATATAAVKVIGNKPVIINNSIGCAKKMLIKSEPPPNITNYQPPAKINRPNIIGSSVPALPNESSDTKMVQLPLPDYIELITQLKDLKGRVTMLEEHFQKCSGFPRK